jgi:transcriptional regulator with XRE-family HTH domain
MNIELKTIASRHGLSELGMCNYLGVPVSTYRKWAKGERALDSAPRRLLALLAMIEAQAPALHETLIGAARAQDQAPLREKARGKGNAPGRPKKRPSEPAAPFAHVVQALPDWMQQAT